MRRTVGILLVLALLITAAARVSSIDSARANFYHVPVSNQPDPNQPTINFTSPEQNRIYNTSDVWLRFSVKKPETWFVQGSSALGETVYACNGKITYIQYILDGQKSENFSANDDEHNVYLNPMRRALWFSFHLTDLSEGTHKIVVNSYGTYYYWQDQDKYSEVFGNSSEIRFDVDTIFPNITVLSPLTGLSTVEFPLNFAVNESVSEIAYSLDGEDNVTVAGNTTLAGIPVGSHNMTVYATDLAGHVGASETINFTIAEPFPTLAVLTIAVAGVVVAGAGFLLYRKRGRGKTQ